MINFIKSKPSYTYFIWISIFIQVSKHIETLSVSIKISKTKTKKILHSSPSLRLCKRIRNIIILLSINNSEFVNYLGQMYPVEFDIKDTTESNTSASYLDLLLSIGRDGQLQTSIYDKRYDFYITNVPFLSSNIQTSPAYGAFISQLIRYARACSLCVCFILPTFK